MSAEYGKGQQVKNVIEHDWIDDLHKLNEVTSTLNRSLDVQQTLTRSLERLVELMDVETGWIFVVDPSAGARWAGRGFALAAYVNLPPALAIDNPRAWRKSCACQDACLAGELTETYNEVKCSRLGEAHRERRGLAVHASAPLQNEGQVLGILNVAAPSWNTFSERALAFLTSVGLQMAAALERARLYDLLREQHAVEQAALLGLSQQLLGRSTLAELTDVLVKEVQRLLRADAVALLLPDRSRPEFLRFRATVGWRSDPELNKSRVVDDDISLAGRIMNSQRPMIVDRREISTTEQEWPPGEDFEVAACAPLVVNDRSIGVMLAFRRTRRAFAPVDLRFLQLMANQAAIAIEKARLLNAERRQIQLRNDIALGRQIQESLLPQENPAIRGWRLASAYRAARIIGGDFYDIFHLEGQADNWGIVVADAADKGVAAALFMVFCRTTIRSAALPNNRPRQTLLRANRFILEDSRSDMFLTAFYGTLSPQDGRLTYSNAGHNPPLLWQHRQATFKPLRTGGMLLGIFDEFDTAEHEVFMEPGDVLILYTDGVTEAVNSEFDEFGVSRLMQVAQKAIGDGKFGDPQALVSDVLREIDEFAGEEPQTDDITLFVFARLENENAG